VHRVPWLRILTSPCVWAIVVTHGASVFGYFTVVNQLPTYMKHILHFNIKAVSPCPRHDLSYVTCLSLFACSM
jgi:hypothetical protein